MVEIKTDGVIGMRCLVDIPIGTSLPLLIFLHGIGEIGMDITKVLKYGPLQQIKDGIDIGEPKVCVHPQNSSGGWSIGEVDEVVEYFKKLAPVDPNKIYLMGASLGGQGVWNYAQS